MRSALGSLIGLALCTATALSQPTPVVLVHGFNSGPDTWQSTKDFLQSTGDFTPFTVASVDADARVSDQADALSAFISANQLAGSAVVIGHSQGGVVARWASRSTPVFGLITIGTPHDGAPIAGTQGLIDITLGYVIERTALIFEDLQDLDGCDLNDEPTDECFSAEAGLYWLTVSGGAAEIALAVYANVFYDGNADMQDLTPGAGIITGLQQSPELEQTSGRRTSIRVSLNNYFSSPFRLACEEACADQMASDMTLAALHIIGEGFRIEYFNDECDPEYLACSSHEEAAEFLIEVGTFLFTFPQFWNEAVVGGWPNDGTIITANMTMPNSNSLVDLGSTAHTEETKQAGLLIQQLRAMTGR